MDEIKNKPVVNEQPKVEPVKNNTPKAKPFNDNAGKPVSPKPIMKQMGLSENDLEPIDRSSSMYKANKSDLGAKNGRFAPNDYSTDFTQQEIDDFLKTIDNKTDSFPQGNPKRKKKVFVNKEEKDAFMKSLPESAEVTADEFDHTWKDENGDPDRWLTYWEVYYDEPNDEEKEYEGVDGDYERSYGPVDSEEKYQAYLKWKENGDSFDNVSDDYDLDDKEKTPEFLKVNGEWIDVKGNQQEWGHHYFTKNGDVYYYSDEDGLEHKVGKLEGSSNENPQNEKEDDALAEMGFGPDNDGDAEEAERAYLNGGNRLDLDYDNRSIRDIANEMANDPTNPYYWYFKNKK